MTTIKRPDGAEIFYQVTGNDTAALPPLVLVHGWCSDHEIWQHQVRYFSAQRRVLVLDRRGHGRSTTSGSGHSAAGHAGDIAAVISDAGLDNVVVAGHAGGSAGVLEFIRTNASLVRAGIIVDSYLYPMARMNDPASPFGRFFGEMIEVMRRHDEQSEHSFREWYTGFFDATCDQVTIKVLTLAVN